MKRISRHNGFTLLELILTIVIFAIVGIMAVSFFHRGVTGTDIAVSQLQADAHLQLVLENMIQAAKANFSDIADNIPAANTTGTAFANNGSYFVAQKEYVCPNNTTNSFETSTKKQFLLVTIRSSAASGVRLSYLFANENVVGNDACP